MSAVKRICVAVEGLPLGIELAAAWTRALPLPDLAAALERDPSELAREDMDVGSRHRSLWAAVEHSWDLLEPDTRTTLAKLSVFRGGFRREAASAVAGATIPLLMKLVDGSLLRMSPDGRYDQHALLFHFARERLSGLGETRFATELAHALYFSELLMRASGTTGQEDLHAAFRVLQEEEPNIVASLEWAAAQARSDVLLTLAEPLLWYFPMNGRFAYGAYVFGEALKKLDRGDVCNADASASLLLSQAWLARYAGSLDEASELAIEGERLARSAGSSLQLVRALDLRGQALTYDCRFQAASALLS